MTPAKCLRHRKPDPKCWWCKAAAISNAAVKREAGRRH